MTIYKNRCKISLHSLHGCCNSLIFKISQCNVGQNALSLMSLDVTKSAMSDMEKQASLHGDVLIFSELRYPCNECNVFLKVNGFWPNLGATSIAVYSENLYSMSFRRPKGGRISESFTLCYRDSSLTLWMTDCFNDFIAPKFGKNQWMNPFNVFQGKTTLSVRMNMFSQNLHILYR